MSASAPDVLEVAAAVSLVLFVLTGSVVVALLAINAFRDSEESRRVRREERAARREGKPS